MVTKRGSFRKEALWIKSLRDMKKSLAQFVSIFIMSMIAVTMITGLDAVWMTIQTHAQDSYVLSNTSDLWITVANPSEQDLWKIEHMEGVNNVEKRMKMTGKAILEDPKKEFNMTIYGIDSSLALNRPYLTEGDEVEKDGIILDQRFARANNLMVGDLLKIELNNYRIEYKIKAIAMTPEEIFSSARMNKFIVVNVDSLKPCFNGSLQYNQIQVALEDGVDQNELWNKVEQIFKDRLISIESRDDMRGFVAVDDRIQQFQTLAIIFPMMFFVVTALITLSTMGRLVEEQRNQIGTMKALGYSKRSIMWHYTSYGVYVGALGVIFGCIIGPNTMGQSLLNQFRRMYALPSYEVVLYWNNIMISALIILFSTGGVAAYSCYQLLGETPAVLLRTKTPKRGSHILLERVKAIWNSMNFSTKLIARNLSRNKLRFLMSLFGIMGCTALILAAFTLNTTMANIPPVYYGEIYKFDERFTLDGKSSDRFLSNLALNAEVELLQQKSMYVTTDHGYRKMVNVTVTSSHNPMLNLPDEHGKGKLILPNDGIVVTRKQAKNMGIAEGDLVYIKCSRGTDQPAKVHQLSFISEGQGIYMSDHFFKSLGEEYKPTSLMVNWDGAPNRVAEFFADSQRVTDRVTLERLRSDFRNNLSMITMSVVLLIVFGVVLAFVVIYNMGILNYFERVRDLSTLKVLGFYDKEIRALILTENVLSTIAGILIGIPFGGVLADSILSRMGSGADYQPMVTMANIAISALLSISFTLIVNAFLARRMKGIDMLEALKSVE